MEKARRKSLEDLMNILTFHKYIAKYIFKIIYKLYLWSSKYSGESFLSSRYIEYPFVIEELERNSIPKNSKILLIGCAGDPLSTILPALGYETYGLDIKYVAIRYPRFHFIQGDIRRTEFPNNYFDVIVAVSTIEHVGMHEKDYEGDKKALKEIARILKKDGIFIITVPIASKLKIYSLERVYDIRSLDTLLNGWQIIRKAFFKIDENGYWTQCPDNELPDPNRGKAVALLVLKPSLNSIEKRLLDKVQ